ncbi:MAG: hypothetical protein IPL53_17460 [Ignavibacteria bacterium]|nr:hypothetical protein [Ignavibacteria bacterium]
MSFIKTLSYRFLFILVFILLTSILTYSQGKHYPVNVSVWFKSLSLNKSDKDSTNFNLNILYSKTGSVRGGNIGVAYTDIQRNLNGFNITGGLTRVKGTLKGVSISGFGNTNEEGVKGFQISGVGNLTNNYLKGAQISGVVNYVVDNITGAQLSLVLNVASENLKGVQLGNSNIIGKSLTGAQLGTTFNVVNDKLTGVQIAPGNLADIVKGGQVGVLNISSVNEGLQLGVFNVTDYQKGVPVGVVNVATKNGGIEGIVYTGNFQSLTAGVKIRSAKFVSILEAGWNEYQSYDLSSWTLAARYGYDFELAKFYKITPDIGYVEIFDDDASNEHEFALQARILGQAQLIKNVRFFAGIGYSQRYEILKNGGNINDGKFIYLAGFSLF